MTVESRLPALLGKKAEDAATAYFAGQGYQVAARNYRVAGIGELDLVLARDRLITIVEVKARRNLISFGGLESSITPAKFRRLRKTTLCYLKEQHLLNNDIAFLAALIQIDAEGNPMSIQEVPIESF